MQTLQKSFSALFITSLLFTGSIASLKQVDAQVPQAPATNEIRTNIFVQDELYLGSNKPRGQVSERDFQIFLQKEVTPRFPDGLTVIDANGQFLGSNGVIKEKTKLLILIHLNTQEDEEEIQEIVDEYKEQFQQESVLRVTSTPRQVRF
ncbi:DUF3574 domain-containing protein [Aliterella atlantica]|uniref:Lipoprotein n=1 Tax=Aliterella atlantica CENA595 TaxID=1618023 RepID=A0A0D8ZRT5_9CYAN|nr:DUF3574 domain-containing protein [Aliterella atlantica]KJH71445.1 lipoprotein [Aliterella atlantica CENA595]